MFFFTFTKFTFLSRDTKLYLMLFTSQDERKLEWLTWMILKQRLHSCYLFVQSIFGKRNFCFNKSLEFTTFRCKNVQSLERKYPKNESEVFQENHRYHTICDTNLHSQKTPLTARNIYAISMSALAHLINLGLVKTFKCDTKNEKLM